MNIDKIKNKLLLGIVASFCGIVIGALVGWQTLTLFSTAVFILTVVGIGIIEQNT